MYLLYDNDYIIRVVSDQHITGRNMSCLQVNNDRDWKSLLYQRLPKDILLTLGIRIKKESKNLRIAIICNWNDQCGISTYSQYLTNAIIPKIKEIKIFSEKNNNQQEQNVVQCWKRGESLAILAENIKEWKPDFVIIQHEYGIFPNAFYFMQLLQSIDKIPYVVVMHSIYRHLDKAVYNECVKNIIVHTKEAKETLIETGNTNTIHVVPHGCVRFDDAAELWNICRSPYTIIQFGFGFSYKGVDRAMRAVAHLLATDKKFNNIQYIYLCSTNPYNKASHAEYCKTLDALAKELDITNNIAIIQKYQTDKMINLYLRLGKVAIFPYLIDKDNEVYGSSGAIRVALANKRPVIASESHLFDDLEGIIPRPKNHIELAKEIDKVFSNSDYKKDLIQKGSIFIQNNTWDKIADQFLDVYANIADQNP